MKATEEEILKSMKIKYYEEGKEIELPEEVKKLTPTEQLQYCWVMGIRYEHEFIK